MRVRYKTVNDALYRAECDMTERKAGNFFEKLREDSRCMWAELVGEEDDNYMEILDEFDRTRGAIMLDRVMKELGFR